MVLQYAGVLFRMRQLRAEYRGTLAWQGVEFFAGLLAVGLHVLPSTERGRTVSLGFC